ncbi:MAG: Bcr/CflA family drug resistance efflux transporter [Alphaproteobacteria bacterium]|nr:MAG: Bcr/CflA family drug resistance efflux transporter [Alphaproteobacteria bacterium]
MGLRPDTLIVVILLTLLTALGPITTDLYLPALPAIQEFFHTDVPTVQLTLSVYMVVFGLCQIFYGPLSDRFGRKPIILVGTLIYLFGSVVCVLAPKIEILIAGRILQALGGCAGVILARTMVRDIYGQSHSARILSYMGTAMALAPALGPIIGGYLTIIYGWQASFVILAVFGGICVLGIIFILQETNQYKDPHAIHPRQTLRNFMTLLHDRSYTGYLLIITFSYSGLFAFISGSAFVFIKILGLSADQYGYCFTTAVVGYMIGTQIGGRIVGTIGIVRIAGIGALTCAIAGISMLIMAIIPVVHVAAVLAPMVLYMTGLGMTFPTSLAGLIGPFPKMVGAASSLTGFIQNSFAAFVGLMVAHSFNMTQLPMAIGICLMGVGAWASYRLLIHKSTP